MFKYKTLMNNKIKYLKKYCQKLAKLKKQNIDINKINELILTRLKFLKFSSKYSYPSKIFDYINEYLKQNNYQINIDNLIKSLTEYKRIYKYHFSYWELEEIPNVIYYQLLDKLCNYIEYYPNTIMLYNLRKEKTVYNILTSIDYLNDLDIDYLILKVSDTDSLLLEKEEYQNLDYATRKQYREKIKQNSSKQKISEYQYANKILDKKLISYHLFKRLNYQSINIVSIVISFFMSFFLTYSLFKLFNNNLWYSTIFINYYFIYKVISLLIPKPFIPKFNITNLSSQCQTMVLKYNILKNDEEVKKQFEELEVIYLKNQYDYLHFTLLVDCTKCDHQIEPFDDEILNTGLMECERLNKKYNKNIFHFVYRKRMQFDNMWYGYKRKNGAIEDFIKLLLKEISIEDDYLYFMGHSDFNNNYKYLIDLNEKDNISELIGTIEHPYNKPIYRNNKIVQGYASISLTGKNIYGESDFKNNVIINIDLYNKLLKDKMPNNILFTSLIRNGSLNNKKEKKKIYNDEALLKNYLHLFFWSFKKNNTINLVNKIKFGHNFFGILISYLTLILIFYTYLTNNFELFFYLSLLLFIFYPIDWYINLKVSLLCCFNLKYRKSIIDSNHKSYFHNLILMLLLIILGLILNHNIMIIIALCFIIMIGMLRRS